MEQLAVSTGLKKKVVNELATFLNVAPQQISTWDRKVVDFMVRNPETFIEFSNGCHYTKWEIYESIRFDR